ncbi:MAG: sugar ABC transporter substrate-binding protein [Clostridia bacterium]|nr:sugar ABC transporter substrate-binding protein [Clostridia bacterium]
MKKLFSLILVAAMLLASFAAVAEVIDTSTLSSDEKAAALGIPAAVALQDTDVLEGKRIGCSIVYKGDEWCAAVASGLEALGAYYGAEITVEDGDLNNETQTKQVENMIANNVDIMMVDPTGFTGVSEALDKAYEAGIPIIIFDGEWQDEEGNTVTDKTVTTVTWDQYDTGVITANYFLDYLRAKGETEATIVELTNAVSEHCQIRFEGLHDTFNAADDIKINIIGKYDSQGNRETAEKAVSAVVQPYQYIISDVDNGAQGAVSALQQAGRDDVKVFSMGAYGAEPFGLLHEEDPNYAACLNVDAWVLAQFIFDGAIKYYKGEEVEPKTNIALFMVDSTNVEDFWTFD